jgi:hypothetical protein
VFLINTVHSGRSNVWKTSDIEDAIDHARKFAAEICGSPESKIGMSRLWVTPEQPKQDEEVKYLGWIFGKRNEDESNINWVPGEPCVFVTVLADEI